MKESEVGTAKDVPHAWVIEIDEMTVAKARELGRVLAEHGLTGHFLSGELADQMREYAKWRQQQKGGDC